MPGPRTMEYQLTTPKSTFDARFLQKEADPPDLEKEGLAYRSWATEPHGIFFMRNMGGLALLVETMSALVEQ